MDAPVDASPRARAVARYVRVTPMKARRLVDVIRGMRADEAVATLRFAPQAASTPVRKVLESAMANAQVKGIGQRDGLVIAAAYVDEGPTQKRFRPRAQGRAYRIAKRTSHITVEVAADPRPRATRSTSPTRGPARSRQQGGTR